MSKRLSSFYILFAATLWGTTGTAQALAPEMAHPIAIGTMRVVIGGLSLLIIAIILRQLKFEKWSFKTILLAAVCMAVYQPLFFSAVSVTGVALGTVIGIGSAPILSGIIEWIFSKRKPQGVWWLSTIISLIGCSLLFLNKESIHVEPYGVLLAIGAGLSFACYTTVSKKLVNAASPLATAAVVFTLSGLMLSPFLLFFDLSWLTELRGIGVSLHLGVLATGLSYFLFSKGLIHVPSSTAVTFALAEPLTATLLGVFLIGEHLNLISWISISLLVLGIGILVRASDSSESKKVKIKLSEQ